MTHHSLQQISWLSQLEPLKVTPWPYQDESLNPQFEILYQNPQPDQGILFSPGKSNPPEFVHYDLSTKDKYGFLGTALGEEISAFQALTDFSDEPDWGMDKNLDLAFSQHFMGGSQGYRHMYYPVSIWHLPCLFSAQGQAPQRAEHFYRLARQAFAKGNSYWGFRLLARALHYIQDMAQPYHTTQTAWDFFHFSSPLGGTTKTTTNYHLAYEALVARILELEAAGILPPDYQRVLEETPALPADSVEELAVTIAEKSCQLAKSTFACCLQIFPQKLYAKHAVKLTASDIEKALKHPQKAQFDTQVKAALKLIAAGSKRFLELACKELPLERMK